MICFDCSILSTSVQSVKLWQFMVGDHFWLVSSISLSFQHLSNVFNVFTCLWCFFSTRFLVFNVFFFCDVLTFLISLYFHQLQCFHSSNTAAETETSLLKFFHNKHTLKLNCFSVICVVVGKFSGKDLVLLCYPPTPLLLLQPSHVRPLPWCRSWVTATAPSLPCGVRQIIEQNLSSTLFIEALFMLRDNLHNYYNFLGFFLLTQLVVVSNLWKLSCVSPLPHVSLIVFLEPGKHCPFFA